jgi:TonB family protein
MDVTDLLRDRSQETSGFQRMMALSIAVHALFFAAFFVAPDAWLSQGATEPPPSIMTISLNGGGDEPRNGGLTAMGGRPVQLQTPPEEVKRPEAVRPPAAKAPEMTLPTPGARPARASSTAVKQAPDEARGRTPTKGADASAGSTTAVTGARGQGFGLSTGGGPGTGVTLDVGDFCCPEYLATMIDRIKANWNPRQSASAQTFVKIKFTIRRDGIIQDPSVETSSGYPLLDFEAQRAVTFTRQLPALPGAFPNATLTVHLNFEYQR